MERIKEIDYVKGMGIMLVVLGHCIPDGMLWKMIYSFHMPLFFMVSGYLFNPCKWPVSRWKAFTVSRFRSYIYPYVCIYLTHLAALMLMSVFIKNEYTQRIPHYFAGLFLARGGREWMPLCTPIWFLPCIFLGSLVYFVVNRVAVWLILPVTLALGVAFTACGVQLPCHLEVSLSMGCFFMAMGSLIRQKGTIAKISPLVAVLMLLAGCACAAYNGFVDINNNKYGNWALFLGSSILISTVVFYISFHITQNLSWLSTMGKETTIIMGFHATLVGLLRKAARTFIRNKCLSAAIVFMGTLLILFVLIYVINRSKKYFRRRK